MTTLKQAVILAGGKGTRLASVLNGLPKPLVDVSGVSLLERQIAELALYGINDIILLVNHGANRIAQYLSEGGDLGVRVTLIDDGEPRGTAGAVLASLDRLDDSFLVVYGDTLFDIDIGRFAAFHHSAGADATLFLHPNDHPHDSDLVTIDENNMVVAFHPYPHPSGFTGANLVNAAFYAMEKRALIPWRGEASPLDFAKHLFPCALKRNMKLAGYRSFEYIKDIGTPDRLAKAVRALEAGVPQRARMSVMQKAVFIDRDGTLNAKRGFITSVDQFELISRAGMAVRLLNEHEYRVVVITNQPVIARGECSFEELRRIHDKMETLLGYEGAFLDGLFFCPHHPDKGFPGEVAELKIDCVCRKPKTGLIDTAAEQLNVDLSRSWFVGDTVLDVETAKRAKIRSILVLTGDAWQGGKNVATPDFTVPDLLAAAELIVESDRN